MTDELKPLQVEGAAWLAERRVAYLCDGVGLGKTPQLIRACDTVGAQKITVACPPAIVAQTCRAFDKWQLFGRSVAALEVSAGRLPSADVLVLSYPMLARDNVRDKVRERGADVLAFDEAHKLKSPGAVTARHAIGKAGITRNAARVWWVSGTAAPNFAHEYYTFAKCAGIWEGDYEAFARKFCVVADDRYGWKVVGDKEATRAELQALLAPVLLERHGRAAPVALHVSEVALDAAPPDLSSVDPDALERISFALECGDLAGLDDPMMATARRLIGTAKAVAAADYVLRDFGGAGTIVFGQHTDVIDVMAAKFGPLCAGVVDGRTTGKKRQKIIDDFATGNSPPIIILHKASGSEGLNMQRACRVYLPEPDWVPATNEQGIARAYRYGQTQDVHAVFMYLPGTLDERVALRLASKVRARDARRELFASKFS